MKLYNEMEKAFLEIEKRFDTHSLERFLDCPYQNLSAVSYTHLDVYKRQLYALFAVSAFHDKFIGTVFLRTCLVTKSRFAPWCNSCLLYTSTTSSGTSLP